MSDNKKGISPAAAGVAGAVIGAAAAAAAIALSDEKNRKKVERILDDIQKGGEKIISEITKRAKEIKEDLNSGKGKLRKISGGKKKE